MTNNDKIFLDGKMTTWQQCDLKMESLLGRNCIYTTINTFAHKPLHLPLKLRYAAESHKALFGTKPALDAAHIAKQINDLLYYGLYPEWGNTVDLYLIPREDGSAQTLLCHRSTTPYEGYSLLSIRPQAAVTNYEIPFEKHHTTISLAAARFADYFARRSGAGIGLRGNRAGVLLSTGDNPIYALRGDTLITTPIEKGARPSAERELMNSLCQMAGVKLIEQEIPTEQLGQMEEVFAFTPIGIQMIGSAGEVKFHSIVAHTLEPHLATLSREGTALL